MTNINNIKKALELESSGQTEQAQIIYRNILGEDPSNHECLHNLGIIFFKKGMVIDAVNLIEQAISIEPNAANYYNTLGSVFYNIDNFDAAMLNFNKAIEVKSNFATAYFNRGKLLKYKLNQPETALHDFQSTIDLEPNFSEAYFDLGDILLNKRQYNEAFKFYNTAIRLKPDYADAYCGRGLIYMMFRHMDSALKNFDHVISINRDHVNAHYNKALSLLLIGDFENGWPLYEWRWEREKIIQFKRNFQAPLWLGLEPIHGKTILLHSEQGLGDTIQFCRYAKMVAELGASVVMEVPGSLLTLIQGLEGISQFVAQGNKLPKLDFHCPLMSLPLAFKTRIENIPNHTPYIKYNKVLSNAIASATKNINGYKVGICWDGSNVDLVSCQRSPGIHYFSQLFSVKNVNFFTLQKSSRDDFFKYAGNSAIKTVHEIDSLTAPFEETASLIMNLDLVITCDTAIAHLAGALGKPVWILLSLNSDFRWLINTEFSPWYPSARLFRQTVLDDWDELFKRVSYHLNAVVSEKLSNTL